jgi:hypothetical protein
MQTFYRLFSMCMSSYTPEALQNLNIMVSSTTGYVEIRAALKYLKPFYNGNSYGEQGENHLLRKDKYQ